MTECVRSGYCCKQSACPWGTWDEEAHQCIHLEGDHPGEYACGIYAEIAAKEADSPINMFGSGWEVVDEATLLTPNGYEIEWDGISPDGEESILIQLGLI